MCDARRAACDVRGAACGASRLRLGIVFSAIEHPPGRADLIALHRFVDTRRHHLYLLYIRAEQNAFPSPDLCQAPPSRPRRASTARPRIAS